MKISNFSRGQALVILLAFMVISITITTAAIIILFVNSQAASNLEQGNMTMAIAESGAENAILLILRNPGYTVSNQTLLVGGGTATVTVTGATTPKTILSIGQQGSFTKKIQVIASFDANHQLLINSWTEIY